MIFIKFNGNWYEQSEHNPQVLFNRRSGFFVRNSTEDIPTDEKIECDGWHELFMLTGFSWMKSSIKETEIWVDPSGGIWGDECHDVDAEYIVEDLFGLDLDIGPASDELIKRGWVKAQTSLMTQYYYEDGMYDDLTRAQVSVLEEYCQYHELPRSFFGMNVYEEE